MRGVSEPRFRHATLGGPDEVQGGCTAVISAKDRQLPPKSKCKNTCPWNSSNGVGAPTSHLPRCSLHQGKQLSLSPPPSSICSHFHLALLCTRLRDADAGGSQQAGPADFAHVSSWWQLTLSCSPYPCPPYLPTPPLLPSFLIPQPAVQVY